MLNTEAVVIWRDADGDYHVEWDQSHPGTQVCVEPLTTVAATLDRDASACRLRISGLPAGNRHFFRLRDQHGNELCAAERKLGMQGTPNFRDFGGYATADGSRVRWGYLFRSGQLAYLSEPDLALLDSLDLELICDFRQASEQQTHPTRLPAGRRPRVVNLPIVPGNSSGVLGDAQSGGAEQAGFGRGDMFDFMRQINREFVESQREMFAGMFREVLDLEEGRFLVHCSAGKDRTGFAAALFLLALGVPQERVMADYLLTGRYFNPERELARVQRKYNLEHIDPEAILPMLEVHEDYLATALASIEVNFGSVERYLEEALGLGPVELAELRGRYLEPAG